jgi:hypothetical protein
MSTRTAGAFLALVVIAAGPVGAPPGGADAQVLTFPGGIPPTNFRAEVEIEASAAQVWAVLTDFPAYPIWNPFIYPITGTPRPGGMLEVTMHPGMQSIPYQAAVVTAEPNRELSWFAYSASVGVFDSTYTFMIEPVRATHVRFVAREGHASLAGILGASLVKDIQSGLDAMAKAARNRAELMRIVPRRQPLGPISPQ